ncbi:hypothetical protein FJY71_03605 [candidate division WOR-3 bacterium]|nr:hypothetical protein [candidate division WOR-3 bacterium]
MKGYQLALTLVALALVGAFCLRPPALPQWDVEVAVPLYRGQLRLGDILDSTRFHVNPDSTLTFALAVPFETVRPDGALDLVGVDELHRLEASDFLFSRVGAAPTRFTLAELLPFPIPDTGVKARLEPFQVVCEHAVPIDGIESAELLEAVVTITAANHTGLRLDSLVVQSPVGPVRFGQLGPGGRAAERRETGGLAIASPLPLRIALGSPGTGPDSLRLTKLDSVVVNVEVDSVRIATGRVRLPRASASRRCPVRLASAKPMRIDSLELAEGHCGFVVVNGFGIPLQVKLTAPRLGVASDRDVAADGSTGLDVNLEHLVIDNRSRTNSLFDFYVTAAVPRAGTWADIGKDDAVEVRYSTSGLKPRTIAGEFRQPVYVASRAFRLPLVPGGVNGLRLSSVELALDVQSEVGFPMELLTRLVAVRDGREVGTLERTLALQPARLGAAAQGSWVLPLAELVNTGADSIVWDYNVRILGQGHFETGSAVGGGAVVSSPLRLAMVPDTVATPAREVRLAEDHRRYLREYLIGGDGALTVANHLPVAVAGRLVLSRASGASVDPGTLVDSIVLPFAVPRGRVDSLGNCVAEERTDVRADLDSVDLTLLRTSPLQARVVFELPASDTVVLRAGDRVGVEALVRLRVRVREPE